MKKIIIAGLTMVLLCAGGYLFAGELDSSAIPSDDTTRMHTITDIYKYLTDVDNAPPSKATGGFSEPIAGPVAVTGTADSVTATTLVDDALNTYSDDAFNGWRIEITAGTGIGQTRAVTDFTGLSGTVTVKTWDTTPDNTSTYELSTPNLDNVFANLQRLPATGQATCYNAAGTLISCAGTGQDGAYQKGAAQRYNKYAIGSDYVTEDLNTGLMWASVGTAAGCNNGGTANWTNALSYCEGLTFAGYSDWRLPNTYELFSIVLLIPAAVGPFINTTAFPSTASDPYWSSTTVVNGTNYALYVAFNFGQATYTDKTIAYFVRCVRGGQ